MNDNIISFPKINPTIQSSSLKERKRLSSSLEEITNQQINKIAKIDLSKSANEFPVPEIKSSWKQPPCSKNQKVEELQFFLELIKDINFEQISKIDDNIIKAFNELIKNKLVSIEKYGIILSEKFENLSELEWLKFFSFISHLHQLNLVEHQVQIKNLKVIGNLKTFYLSHLEKCTDLVSFENEIKSDENGYYSFSSSFSLEGFKEPAKMKYLEEITLNNVKLCDAKILLSFSDLPVLKRLILKDCEINYEALEKLLPKLSFVKIKTPISETGNNCTFHQLWQWQHKYPKVDLSECLNIKEGASLKDRWKEDLTDYQQVMKICSNKPKDDYLFGMANFESYKIPLVELIKKLENEELKVFSFPGKLDKDKKEKLRYANVSFYGHNNLTDQIGFFFNASPIKSVHSKTRVATQGPKTNTIGDFWGAIWKMKTEFIVMLTPCVDDYKVIKCAQYWPSMPQLTGSCRDSLENNFFITLQEEKIQDLGIIRRKFQVRLGEESRIVEQLQMPAWQDQSTLSETTLYRLVNIIQSTEELFETPAFYHCSAGIGRTGVMIACLIIKEMLPEMIQKTKDENGFFQPENIYLDVEKLLVALRQQRMGMIQTSDQLISVIQFFIKELTIQAKTNFSNKIS